VGDADGKPAKLGKDDLKAMDKLLEKRTVSDELRVEQYGDRVDVNAAKFDARSGETQGDNTNREMIELGERNWGSEMQISGTVPGSRRSAARLQCQTHKLGFSCDIIHCCRESKHMGNIVKCSIQFFR
jgi:hypothetical protein